MTDITVTRKRGRPSGSLNKATADVKELCRSYTPQVIEELLRIAQNSENDSARVAAIKEILDRGHGKTKQEIDGNVSGDIKLTWL